MMKFYRDFPSPDRCRQDGQRGMPNLTGSPAASPVKDIIPQEKLIPSTLPADETLIDKHRVIVNILS